MNSFWTVSNLGGSGGLETTLFEQFLLSEGVVILKELILNTFYFQRVWWSWKNCVFNQFLFWEAVVVLKELILNSFYFQRVWWSWKNWFWTVSTFRGCSSRVWWCGGLERTHFEQFLIWEGLWWSWNNSFWTVSTLGGCSSLERTDF